MEPSHARAARAGFHEAAGGAAREAGPAGRRGQAALQPAQEVHSRRPGWPHSGEGPLQVPQPLGRGRGGHGHGLRQQHGLWLSAGPRARARPAEPGPRARAGPRLPLPPRWHAPARVARAAPHLHQRAAHPDRAGAAARLAGPASQRRAVGRHRPGEGRARQLGRAPPRHAGRGPVRDRQGEVQGAAAGRHRRAQHGDGDAERHQRRVGPAVLRAHPAGEHPQGALTEGGAHRDPRAHPARALRGPQAPRGPQACPRPRPGARPCVRPWRG